ncbi:MAG: hypothetical protein HY892_05855 [Deltaproteobacteria bacterium]|nr:hypothetical protein [Deltaproteobacteria bacterium]
MSNARNRCAYCEREKQLTREHVVPNFLYKANPLAKFGYNLRADKFMAWEAQVKDVCADCNNHYLSKVDSYAKDFFKANRIEKMVTEEKTVRITYDHSLLLRVLFKLTFNCLRFKGEDARWIEHFKEYILHGTGFPAYYRIKIGIEVVPCHRIMEKERASLSGESKTWKYLPPHMIRMGNICGISGDDVFARYVFVNNFYFYCIVCPEPDAQEKLKVAMKRLRSTWPSILFLHPHKTSMTLRVSDDSIIKKYSDTAAMLSDKWAEYLKTDNTPRNRVQRIAEKAGSR